MLNTTYLRFFVLNAALVATTATTATIVNTQQQEALPPAQKAFLPPVTNATTTAEVTVTTAPTRSPTRGPQNDNPTTSPVDNSNSNSDDPITPAGTPTEHTTAPECDPSPECVPYWLNGIYYHNCCPPPPLPPMCTPRESSSSPQTGDIEDRRTNIDRHADHCQAFLVFESPFLSVSSGRSDPHDELFVPDRVVLWLGPPQLMRDTKGNIDTMVSRVMEYILTPKSEAGHNRKGRQDLRNTNAAVDAVSYTLTVRPAGYAATWNEVLRLYQASIAPNNGFRGPPDTWLEAGAPTASIVAREANSPRQQFVSAIKARWVFDPSTDPDLQELFEIALGGGGQQQETTATPASFEDLYHALVNHRNNHLPPPPPPPPPRRYQDRFDRVHNYVQDQYENVNNYVQQTAFYGGRGRKTSEVSSVPASSSSTLDDSSVISQQEEETEVHLGGPSLRGGSGVQ